MDPVRWGVISTAKIGVEKVLPGMKKSPHIKLVGMASRDLARAQDWAKKLGIPKTYGSYEEMLADPEIEAVYNPLPNHLHVPLTLAAAKAGKHVLCEKPIAITAREAEALRQLPKDILVAEAFMVRHHPQWLTARERVRGGACGPVQAIQTFFTYYLDDPANVRNIAAIGGGGILDIGCYAVLTARFIFEAEPLRVVSLIDYDPKFKTDRMASGIADFGNGRRLTFTISTQSCPHQRVEIIGPKGRIEVSIPFNAPPTGTTRVLYDQGKALGGAQVETITIPESDQYQLQGEAFSRAVRGEEKLGWGVEDAILNMRVLDALFKSNETGQWEKV